MSLDKLRSFRYITDVPSTSFTVSITSLVTFYIDSDTVLLTVTKVMKDHSKISVSHRAKLAIVELSKVDFRLKSVIIPIAIIDVPDLGEPQPFMWVLAIKTLSKNGSNTRFRAQLDSAKEKSLLSYSVLGNVATIILCMFRMLTRILPMRIMHSKVDRIVLFARNVIKAFIQSMWSKRLIIYKPQLNSLKLTHSSWTTSGVHLCRSPESSKQTLICISPSSHSLSK